ncbi:MAG TPA: bifunctional riboflavin kinase/FAD synthetase [Dermatophilaceae bacterium]|nr:bifunctional riboflavin kinase/FAD synthetase [Dermatophilaceae bacterium]
MHRWTDPGQVPADLGPSVVTLGNFDGVHRGHQAVLRTVVDQARERHAASVAVTFEPHPVAVLRPDQAPQILTGAEQRLELLAATGLDAVLVLQFTPELAGWTPQRFVREVFVDALHAVAVVVGEDTRFGVRNSGDVSTLRDLGVQLGFEVVVLPAVGEGARYSSSQVRAALAAGDVAQAAHVLGRPHSVTGAVVHGDHRGRELGYPTANLAQTSVGLVPADGVYAGWLVRPSLPASHPDHRMPAAVSIGTNPTFGGTSRRVEAYALDRTDLDLYGETLTLELVERLRPTERFDSVQALLVQMAHDVARCRVIMGGAGMNHARAAVDGPVPCPSMSRPDPQE